MATKKEVLNGDLGTFHNFPDFVLIKKTMTSSILENNEEINKKFRLLYFNVKQNFKT